MRFSPEFLDDLRDRLPISEVIGSRVTWDRKKTRAAKGDYWACCPIHGENSPSFHCEDRKGRYHCFGCGAGGNHFKFLMELDGVSFPRAVEMVASLAGVPLPSERAETAAERAERDARAQQRARAQADRARSQELEEERRVETVRGIWSDGVPIAGTLAERYLTGRGIPQMAWPASIRFHSGLAFNGSAQPALICGVQNRDRKLVAVWRIFLNSDGTALTGDDGKKVKLGLGPAGGGAVRLGPAAEEISVCEGVETGFGVGCLTKWKSPVWPLLSTSGMIAWEPPTGTKKVAIYSDGDRYKVKADWTVTDPPGRIAAEKLRARLADMGIAAVVHEPPAGTDWLDIWRTLIADEGRARDVQYATG